MPSRFFTAFQLALTLTAAAGALVGLELPVSAFAEEADDGAVTPYRPTVSNPAQLPVPGQLEMELGGLRSRSGGSSGDSPGNSSRSSIPYLIKLAFTDEWGVLLGGDAHVWSHDPSTQAQGVGDTSVTVKRAWLVDKATAFGLEVGVKLPSANDNIGSGRADTVVNGIFSRDLGAVHMDLNLNATRLGAHEPGSSRTQVGAAASFSADVSAHWGIVGEVSGSQRSGTAHAEQLLAALTYSPTKRLVFDFGMARAPKPSPGNVQWFAGVVFPIANLW